MNAPSRQRGFLLIAVLVIVMLASMVALSLLFRMRAEQASFSAAVGSEQAWYAAASGIHQAMHLAVLGRNDPAPWQNNPGAFRHQIILDDGADRWFFTIFSPAAAGESQVRYGLSDESAKLNLNTATTESLQRATHLAPAVIQAIASAPAPGTNAPRSEIDPTAAPSRPAFSTLDELLKIPGSTPGMIYGEDANHNFILDPNEDDGVLQFPPDDSDGQLFLGLREVGTVYSYEFDIASDGSPRIQLNTPLELFPEETGLPAKAAAFIERAWKEKKTFASPADLLTEPDKVEDPQSPGVGKDELPLILEKLTATFEPKRVGLININTAPLAVLQAIPGVDLAKAERIVSARESLPIEMRASPAWLYQEGILTVPEFRKAAPLITVNSFQFSFNIVGYALPSGRYRVFEVVIDTADKQPQITYLRDITRLGLPFALPTGEDTLNVETPAPI